MIRLFVDDDPDCVVECTMTGMPAPAHLPASPRPVPGAGYLRKYPVRLDPPLIVVQRTR